MTDETVILVRKQPETHVIISSPIEKVVIDKNANKTSVVISQQRGAQGLRGIGFDGMFVPANYVRIFNSHIVGNSENFLANALLNGDAYFGALTIGSVIRISANPGYGNPLDDWIEVSIQDSDFWVMIERVSLTATSFDYLDTEVMPITLVGKSGREGLPPIFTRQNAVVPLVGLTRYYFEEDGIVAKARVSLGTPSEGAPVIVDILRNGVSIGLISLPEGENTILTPVGVAVASGDYLTVTIVSVGTTNPGSDLTVGLIIN